MNISDLISFRTQTNTLEISDNIFFILIDSPNTFT